VERKITVILAADVAGYSRLVAEDEEETLQRLASYREVFSDFITRSGGRIFNTAGDAILAEFPSAVYAVRCALDVQEAIRARNLAYPQSRHMNFRIGISVGDVVQRDGDLLGDGVNVAARLEGMAPPGGVCISRSVHEAVANKISLKFTDLGNRQLKNIPDPVHAYAIGGEALAPASPRLLRLDPSLLGSVGSRAAGWLSGHRLTTAAILIAGAALLATVYWPHTEERTSVAARRETSPVREPIEAAKAPAERPVSAKKPSTPDATRPAVPPTPAAVAPDDGSDSAAAAPAPEVQAATPGRKPLDPLATALVLPRKMRECREGTGEDARAACQAVIDNRLVTGAELAEVQLKLGKSLRESGDLDRAVTALSESIATSPTAEAYNNRGIAYYLKGDRERAVADYTEAVRIDPQHGEALNNRAWTYFKLGRAQAALADADRAVRLLPAQAYTWDTRAHVNELLGNRDAAIRDYRKALSLDAGSDASRKGLERLGATP
jgi:class 3 adenylate cyclase/regulator of sirC expression with transglutaminase-like and TPR domain